MAKRGVAQVVRQRDGLDQIFVELQRAGNAAPQLRDLERMGQARAEQVAFVVQKHLRLVDQAPECRGMDHPVPVALKSGPRWRLGLWKTPSAAGTRVAGKTGERGLVRHGVGRCHHTWQLALITSATIASGALRTEALPTGSISTNLIAPPSAFLSTRMRSR